MLAVVVWVRWEGWLGEWGERRGEVDDEKGLGGIYGIGRFLWMN